MRTTPGAVITLCFAIISGTLFSQDKAATTAISDRFIGAWRLVSIEEPDAKGKIHTADCTGVLVFTRDGHISVQVMYRNPQAANSAAPVQYTQGGYEASFGTYYIDDARSFSYHVEGALVRTLVGKDLSRVYEFSGNRLIVRSLDPSEHWKVTWERY